MDMDMDMDVDTDADMDILARTYRHGHGHGRGSRCGNGNDMDIRVDTKINCFINSNLNFYQVNHFIVSKLRILMFDRFRVLSLVEIVDSLL
jgi:hypothetical protein